jgi:thymidylate synthase
MKVYKGRGLGDFYYQMIRDITHEGREIVTRGQRCLELPEPVTLVYESPGYCWMDIPERRFNPFFALAEVPWILTGNGNAEWISYFNKQMLEYLDEGRIEFHGSYGLRMRHWTDDNEELEVVDQIAHVARKL